MKRSLGNWSLRTRLVLWVSLLCTFVSACLAGVALYVSNRYEDILVNQLIQAEVDHLSERIHAGDAVVLPHSTQLTGYFVDDPNTETLPQALRGLLPGIYEAALPEHPDALVAIKQIDKRYLYLVINLPALELDEARLYYTMLGMTLIGTVLSTILALALAKRVIAPVAQLAKQVNSIQPSQKNPPFAPNFAQDEVGELARAFDGFQARHRELTKREQQFHADTSHELRTPLAVIVGATEVLAGDSNLTPASRRRIERVQRGAAELSELMDALMELARDSAVAGAETPIDVSQVLQHACAQQSAMMQNDGITWRALQGEGLCVAVRATPLRAVISNMLRRVMQGRHGGSIGAKFWDGCIELSYVEPGYEYLAPISVKKVPERERSSALMLMLRLCESNDWSMTEQIDDQQYTLTLTLTGAKNTRAFESVTALEPAELRSQFARFPPLGFTANECGGMPGFIAPFDVLTSADASLKKRLSRLPFFLKWRKLLQWRCQFLGSTVSEYLSIPPDLDMTKLSMDLLELRTKFPLTIVKDLPMASSLLNPISNDIAKNLRQNLTALGFVMLTGQALAYVPINFASVDEYLSRLSAVRRKNLRRKLRARAEIEIIELHAGSAALEDEELLGLLYQLYLNVYQQSELHFDCHTADFFRAVFQDRQSGGIVFLYRSENELIGFNLCYVYGTALVDKYIGFSYPKARELNLYFVSWFYNIDYALRHKLTTYIAGWTDPEVKATLGARFTMTQHAVYARNPVVRYLLRKLSGNFEADKHFLESQI